MSNEKIRQDVLTYMESHATHPVSYDDLGRDLRYKGKGLGALWTEIELMIKDGLLVKTRFNTLGLPRAMGLVTGRLQVTQKGYGFVVPLEKTEEGDLFIPAMHLSGAMNEDLVIARVSDHGYGGRREGKVIRILERAHERFVGTFTRSGDFGFVTPDNRHIGQDIYVRRKDFLNARNGDKVVVKITVWPNGRQKAEGTITEILGKKGDVGIDIISIIKDKDLPLDFPKEVKEAAQLVPQVIPKKDLKGRLDRRKWPIITVDGVDSKDLDDAIYAEKRGEDYFLGVYIAEVSHYVRPRGELDREAYARGTSVYLVDRVLPMLPPLLSNGICSLNEGEERLAFSCLMQLDESGNIHSYQFVKSVIRSRVKGVYKEINALLDGSNDPALVTKYKDVMTQLPAMTELYEKRLALRKARGAMDIESDEAKLVMDEEGRCVDIVKRTRGVSECMIEEFMLLANQCAANAGRTHHVPFVYRIHEAPDAERMEKLSNTLKACGLNVHFAGEVPTQLELSAILDETRGQPIQIPVHTGILRSMQKARYSPEPKGHYGLVLADYAHFTSPIRRYPDLAIHRILTDMLVGKPEQELIKDYTGFATHASEQSSRQEVSAVRIERDVEDLYKAEYMHNHLGEVYTGTVAGVTPRGIFVALENTVEGFVPAAQLCKGEATVVEGVSILDPLTGKRWMLGDPVKVQVAGANVALGRIDFDYMPL